MVSVQWKLNDFGLWRSRASARIWTAEKTSKYLLAQRYVPENFDGLLLGPSLSANINPAPFPGARFFNLSMQGANITEVRAAAEPALQRGTFKVVVVCLNPYWIKDSGIKGDQISEKEIVGSLFSLLPFRIAEARYRAWRNPDWDIFHRSENGYNDFHRLKRDIQYSDYKKSRIKRTSSVDPEALEEFRGLVELARNRGARILGYYHPLPLDQQTRMNPENVSSDHQFRTRMEEILRPGEIICDFQVPDFDSLAADDANYSDGHLSERGAQLVAEALAQRIGKALAIAP